MCFGSGQVRADAHNGHPLCFCGGPAAPYYRAAHDEREPGHAVHFLHEMFGEAVLADALLY